MMDTVAIHRCFVSEPMGEKAATDIAGIGETLGIKLQMLGFDKASTVLGQFLICKKNSELFEAWMTTCGANTKEAADCYKCLSDWCDQFL